MRRIQIYIDEVLDDTLAVEAARRGVSKAALIRHAVSTEFKPMSPSMEDGWQSMVGWLDDPPVDDIDEAIYGPSQ
jgi:hypothetical protein